MPHNTVNLNMTWRTEKANGGYCVIAVCFGFMFPVLFSNPHGSLRESGLVDATNVTKKFLAGLIVNYDIK